MPHVPFSFEFDPHLAPEALLTPPDAARADEIARAVVLQTTNTDDDESRPLPLNDRVALDAPPSLVVGSRIPCDLAHRAYVEFEGRVGRYPAGEVVVAAGRARRVPLALGEVPIETPGDYRLRVVLEADAQLGWAHPDTRSIWPETIVSDWTGVRVLRR